MDGLWDLEKHGLTQSLISEFFCCPERLKLGYIKGYSEKKTADHLAFGNMVHKILELYYGDPGNDGSFISEAIEEGIVAEKVKLECTITDESTDIAIEKNFAMAEVTARQYIKYWKEKDEKLEWIGLEKIFKTAYAHQNSLSKRTTLLNGKQDGVFSRDGKKWLFETKTKGNILDDTLIDRLKYDLQVNMYILCEYLMTGKRPVGVLYNLIKRPMLRMKSGENPFTFAARCEADIKAMPETYFKRYHVYILKDEFEVWQRSFESQLEMIWDWWEGKYQFKNSGACSGAWGPCKFIPICATNTFAGYNVRTAVFPELEEEKKEED